MRRASAADHGQRLHYPRYHAREQPRHARIRLAPPTAPLRAPGARAGSRGSDEGSSQVLIDCLLGDPERTSDADCFQFAGVDQAIHGHL